MPRVRFTKNFDFRVNKNVVRAYKAGSEYLVSQEAAAKAVERGAATPVETRGRRRKDDDASR